MKWHSFFPFLIFLTGTDVFASNYILLTGQNATNSNTTTNSVEASFDSKKHADSDTPKDWSYSIDFTGTDENTPTTYVLTLIPGTKFFSAPFSTTLYTSDEALIIDVTSPRGWFAGIGYEYSRQQGSGTPNTFSNIGTFEFGHEVEYDKKGKKEDDFIPSYKWKLTSNSGLLSSDSYVVARLNGSLYPQAANSLTENSYELALTWDPKEWITMESSYEQFSYNNDPNNFALLKSPRRGLPTSLDAYSAQAEITFHMSDSWDIEAKETYSVAATSDQTITDEETYTLTYIANAFEIGAGYDHQNPQNVVPTDYGIISLKLNF